MGHAEDAFKAAQKLIAEAEESQADKLDFDRPETHALQTLPAEIANLTGLQRLDLDGTQVTDLSPISQITGLQTLTLDGTQVTDLSPIGQITGLQTLVLSGTQVTDLSPIGQITGLQTLSLNGTQVTDLSPISQITGLQRLFFDGTQVTDLSPLRQITGLQMLSLNGTQVTDLSPISQITGLQTLTLDNTQVTDLSPISQITGLQWLSLSGTQVTDLSPISQITGLKTLTLDSTQVTDLRPIKDHRELIEGAKTFFGLTFRNAAATRYDPELARLSEIKDGETRTSETLAYLNTLPPWPEPLSWLASVEASGGKSTPAAPEIQAAKSQIVFLLEHAALTRINAEATASQIRFALRDVPATDGNRLPEILQSYENMAAILEGLAKDAGNPQISDTEQALQARIAELEAEVGKMNVALADAEKRAATAEALAKANDFWANTKKGAGLAAGAGTIGLVAVGVPTALVYFLGADHPLIQAYLTTIGKLPK